MNFKNKTVFITGANRGIGKSLVEAALEKGARKVYASARNVEELHAFKGNVNPIRLDITNEKEIAEAASIASDTQVLLNNAGTLNSGEILKGDLEGFQKDMDVNFFGTIKMMRAFAPILEKNDDARIINIVSVAVYVNFPYIAGYCASKAALYSATQAARIELSRRGIAVHAINPGAIKTDMTKGSEMEMTSPEDVAKSVLEEVEKESPDIVPDKIGQSMFDLWKKSPKKLEDFSAKMFFGE